MQSSSVLVSSFGMASYLKDLERDGSALPRIRPGSATLVRETRRVNFDEERYSRPRSPSNGVYTRQSDSPLFQPRPPSPGAASRRQLQEMQDQLKQFKDDLAKKDSLIQQLVSMESVPKVTVRSQADSVRMENLFLGDRQSLEAARSEVAALQVKNEKLTNKLRELENEVEIRDVKIKEMKMMVETSHENESRLQSVVDSLRSQVADLEGRAGAFESVAGRSEFTVMALQKENKQSQERIVELESRQRKQLEEREEAQARVESLERKLNDVLTQFTSMLKIEIFSGTSATVEEICHKFNDLNQENAMLKGKLMTVQETLNNSELETKASRETIMRLVSEMGRDQQMQTRYTNEIDALRSERDVERGARQELEQDKQLLRDRLDSAHRTIEAQKKEIEIRDARISSLDREMRSSTTNVRTASTQYQLFREKLVDVLRDFDDGVHSSEESIIRKVEGLMYSTRDWRAKLETLESRVSQLTEQLETQYELHKTAAHRARKAETELSEVTKRLQSAEGELAAGDVLRDGFRSDKEQYMRCLQQLGEVMKMDRISIDLGMDMTMDALIARACQLVKLEKDALADRSTTIYNLQRKVKGLKEQLESKDLHIDLLRKKITSLEEKILGKTTIERERDAETLRVRKIEKLSEKYKIQLEDARQEIINLKAQLLGASELRVRTMEQRKECEELASQVEELEHLRRKQAKKIHQLKQEVDTSNQSSQENRVVADNAVQALTSELRTTKTALSTIQSREKTLIDFRNVVARMLGLDINTLAIPDYEIISRLEKLINAHHSHTFTTLSLEEALADMEDGFFTGYQEYRNTVGASESQNIVRSRERIRRKAMKARARSVSPQRRIDPKVY